MLLGALALSSVELLFPFGRDQGNYAYPAWAWLEGQMPYRDVYVFKPPATVWVHALAQLLFGHSLVAVRILDLGWTAATALTISAIVRRWTSASGTGTPPRPALAGPLAGPAAGLLYAFLYTNFDFWNTCQTDGWFNLPMALAILLTTRVWTGESANRMLLVAGALVGLAMDFKYTAAAMTLPIAGVLGLAALRDRKLGLLTGRAALGVTGAVLVLGATAFWLWVNGAMPGFLDSQTALLPAYVAKTGKSQGLLHKFAVVYSRLSTLPELRFELALVSLGLPVVAMRARRDPRVLLALLWYAGGLISTIAQDKYFRYHFLSTLPGAAVIGALAIDALLGVVRRRLGARAQAVAAMVVAALLIAPSNYPARYGIAARTLTGSLTLREYWSQKAFKLDKKPLIEVYDAADRVAALSKPGDRVYVWGFDPLINFMANRLTVSRFLYNYPFAVSWGDPRYEDELMTALRATPPSLFVVASNDVNKGVTGNEADSRALFESFAALKAFVTEGYTEVEQVHSYTIYRKKP